ncbi:MFS transporter [Actinospica durhamensis]|uniref:MFS transporter n=1 Tax=Actinospica durhamensis TaxID=1508375 RepID=A0A941ERH7_9ACTN|nr:MFS transporter [Actinospica durhamensis]MBR7833769.1 MFS transporter [Actinospica durhamensis]
MRSTETPAVTPMAPSAADAPPKTGLPMAALLALALAVFITSLTETLPAGLLPAMSAGLHVGESAAGQTVTVYALGTVLTAIPLAAATATWRRKRLLMTAMLGFAVANAVTAMSANYPLTLVGRFVAGVAAGVAWALLAGYAARMVAPRLEGRAIAVAMAGIPLALSLGVPAGTLLGRLEAWQAAFLTMSGLTLILLLWISAVVPDHPGQKQGGRIPVLQTLRVPGVAPVLFVTLVFVLAHTVLYAYIAAFLQHIGLGAQTDVVLLVFGVASLVSIWVVGALIHRHLRALTLAATVLVGVAAALLGAVAGLHAMVYVAAALWGLGWGGVPTLLQSAAGRVGGRSADAVQAMLVTLWNAAMAAGGIVGGGLLSLAGVGAIPWSVLILLVPVLIAVIASREHGFPTEGTTGAS